MAFRFRPGRKVCGISVAAAIAIASIQPVLASGKHGSGRDIEVLIDQAMMVRLARPAAEIVVGNPSIADVAVQSGDTLILTGKSFGETNLIVTDVKGKILVNRRIVVQEPNGRFVTVYRGVRRETFHCAPNCETPLVIGDNDKYFDAIAKEIRAKQGIGQSAAEGSGGE
ncbi:MAG: pilus assembly protein N-terminal domain-containing protein [Methyloceanibacter sp.]|nr:pilus assembly protein N-terminal domain-containing protein [Methyloceanibacter sp.]